MCAFDDEPTGDVEAISTNEKRNDVSPTTFERKVTSKSLEVMMEPTFSSVLSVLDSTPMAA